MWSRASESSGISVAWRSCSTTRPPKPSGVLMPVPTAVPPIGSSARRASVPRSRSVPWLHWLAQPPASWPRVIGTASMRWVRPALTTCFQSWALRFSTAPRWSSAGTVSRTIASAAARWIVVGKTSLELCEALTWSFGCTLWPDAREASVAMTSLAFMFELVPEPVWNTSMGNWSSYAPDATSSAAAATASARSASSTPRSLLTRAHAPLTRPSARICAGSMGRPEIGKFSTARWVCAAHNAAAGTRTSLMVSCSIRYSCSSVMGCSLSPESGDHLHGVTRREVGEEALRGRPTEVDAAVRALGEAARVERDRRREEHRVGHVGVVEVADVVGVLVVDRERAGRRRVLPRRAECAHRAVGHVALAVGEPGLLRGEVDARDRRRRARRAAREGG